MAKGAFYTILSAKARDNEIVVMDDLKFSEPKTRRGAEFFKRFVSRQEFSKAKNGKGVLIALPARDTVVERALRNLPNLDVEEARNLNAWKALQYKYILFPKEALTKI